MVAHVDPEILALAALGEPAADDADRAHLAACPPCAEEMASLAAVVRTGRAVTAADALVSPSLAVWDRIRTELDLSVGLRPEGARSRPEARSGVAPVVVLRRRRAPWIAVAAAAGLIVGGAGGAWWLRPDRPGPVEPTVIAQAALDPLPGRAASGQARVEEEADGARVLVVTLDGGQREGDYREVWLIDPDDLTRLVSLGALADLQGRFTVPNGLDLADFAVVDVSEERFDGVPAHSGDSVVRGTLGV